MEDTLPNPFSIKVISDPDNFCDRSREIKKLIEYAGSSTNVLMFSPRRYGKTSLAKRVQSILREKKVITIYIDLFGLSSIDNIAGRIAKGIYQGIQSNNSLLQKAIGTIKSFRPVIRPDEKGVSISVEAAGQNIFGVDLLDKTMEDLGNFIISNNKKINIVFDEFQEITVVGGINVEGILRSHIQEQNASFFFIGSRRRILLEMFNQKRRPFFQSAINFQIDSLPHDELVEFIYDKFEAGKRKCSKSLVETIVDIVSDHPYYSQKLSLLIYDLAGRSVTKDDLMAGYNSLLKNETYVFEAILQGLAPQQIAVIKAIARESSKSILSGQYMKKHNLKSIGGVQAALRKLSILDHIEKDTTGLWKIVDPVFAKWLAAN